MKITETQLRKELVDQLKEKNMMTKYHLCEIEEYIQYWKINRDLFEDIRKRGTKVTSYNSKGCEVIKTNESIVDAQKNSAAMLKILSTLKLQEPVFKGSENDYL